MIVNADRPRCPGDCHEDFENKWDDSSEPDDFFDAGKHVVQVSERYDSVESRNSKSPTRRRGHTDRASLTRLNHSRG